LHNWEVIVRILVTGGAGFIGGNLCRRLVADEHDVVVIDNLSTGSAANLDGVPVDFREATILDPDALAEASQGVDAIIHLAAIPSVPRSVAAPMPSHEANATGTLRVLEAAREIGAHVTVASSSSVYGANPELPKRETMMARPRSPYAVSKLATESYAIAWGLTYELPTIAFRFFNVYGPLQAAGHAYAAVIPAFTQAALDGAPLPVQGDGLQTRDFTFVDSVTQILARAATERVASDMPVNLAFGSRRSLLDVIAELEGVLGRSLEIEHLPPRVGDVRDSQADNALLRQLFPGIEPVDFEVGLRRTVEWFQTR
jgi:UDP-glucose 4-epimerase